MTNEKRQELIDAVAIRAENSRLVTHAEAIEAVLDEDLIGRLYARTGAISTLLLYIRQHQTDC